MSKTRIPEFKSYQEEAEFWDTHDLTELEDELELVEEEVFVRPRKQVVSIRLDRRMVEALKALAVRKGLGYSTLVRMWVVERLRRELSRKER